MASTVCTLVPGCSVFFCLITLRFFCWFSVVLMAKFVLPYSTLIKFDFGLTFSNFVRNFTGKWLPVFFSVQQFSLQQFCCLHFFTRLRESLVFSDHIDNSERE